MANPEDPIIVSDDEDSRRPRRACRRDILPSSWFGQRSRRRVSRGSIGPGIGHCPGHTIREHNMFAYIVRLSALAAPTYGEGTLPSGIHYSIHGRNAEYLRDGRFDQIRIPTLQSVELAMASELSERDKQLADSGERLRFMTYCHDQAQQEVVELQQQLVKLRQQQPVQMS